MDRKFSTALTVSLLFMLTYMCVLKPQRPKPESAGPGTTPAATTTDTTTDSVTTATEETTPPTNATQADVRDDIVVETDLYVARFTSKGAALLDLYSKKYQRRVLNGEAVTDPELDNRLALCRDMDHGHPALLLQTNPGTGVPIQSLAWDFQLLEGDQKGVMFWFEDGSGTRYEKVIRFHDSLELIDLDINIQYGPDQPPSQPALFLSGAYLPDPGSARFQTPTSAVVAYGDEYVQESAGDPGDVGVQGQRVEFFGTINNYFSFVLRPDDETAALVTNVHYEPVIDRFALAEEVEELAREGRPPTAGGLAELEDDHRSNIRTTATLSVPAGPAQTRQLRFTMFAGPKDPILMRDDIYESFRQLYTEDYGAIAMFRWINPTLLWVMRMFQGLVINWGIAIILLTVLVKVLLFPMNRLQSRSMEQFQKKMAKLKPKLDELKKKFKGNTRKFHEAQQKLMRENNVRAPVLGCLIIFLQFPVFIGLFQILRFSFELRHEPFFFWIDDLSMPDALGLPFSLPLIGDSINILPILMIIAMVAHTKTMPKPADPQAAQMQKTMLFMPFIFGIFLYAYPSGLSLYMLVNALLGIVQSKFLKVSVAT